MSRETLKTLFVATALCLVCSMLVSISAVTLRPRQLENKALDKKFNVLSIAGVFGEPIEFQLAEPIEGARGAIVREIRVADGDTIEANQIVLKLGTSTSIACPHSGRIAKVHVKIDDFVEVGSPLLTIDREANPVESDIRNVFQQQVEVRIVELKSGAYVTELGGTDFSSNPEMYDQRQTLTDPELHRVLSTDEDVARIKKVEKYSSVYLFKNADGEIDQVVLPIRGMGLWSILWGFVALDADLTTIRGVGYYEHAETPGLGGEVDNPRWKQKWIGKKAFDGDQVKIEVTGGAVKKDPQNAIYQVDGLSGATFTSNGVTNMLKFWLGKNGFGPFLQELRENQVASTGEIDG